MKFRIPALLAGWLMFLLFASQTAVSQPQICGIPPEMTPLCADACIICDIDGFTGTNSSGTVAIGEAPPDFCTFTVHNARWIAFIAGSTNLEVQVDVSNCADNNGLEVGLYESTDCLTFQRVSNCRGGFNSIGNNNSATLTTNVPLVIGQYYYLVMDGSLGDVCDWEFTVISGSTQVAPIVSSGPVNGPSSICPNVEVEYFVTLQNGATTYEWTLDNVSLGFGTSMPITWPAPGTYMLCVTASNACDVAPGTCQTIVVDSLPPTVINPTVCDGDTFYVADSIELTASGTFNFNFSSGIGCDSAVQVDLVIELPIFNNIDLSICDSDTIYMGGIPYFETGVYQQVFTSAKGCDSTVNLNLMVITCNLRAPFSVTNPRCFGEANGQVDFELKNGVGPYNYSWELFGGSLTGSGTVSNVNQTESISGLASGTYIITINDQAGGLRILIAEIEDPPVLTGLLVESNYNGVNVSCKGASDGFVAVFPSGGIPPYTYQWSNGSDSIGIIGLPAGSYSATIRDEANCTATLTDTLNEPEYLRFTVAPTDPGCDGPESGIIEIIDPKGGIAPYLFSHSDGLPSARMRYENLPEGNYTVAILDANNCLSDTSFTTVATILPVIDLGPNLKTPLGDEVSLTVTSNIPLDTINWRPFTGLDCPNCFLPIAIPEGTTTYYAYAYSEAGCLAVDSVTIETEPRRNVWIPNAFSPNGDGRNDRFNLDGGPEIAVIRSLQIYSQWGEVIYNGTDLAAGDQDGWDGTVKGQAAKTDVYGWSAWVDFLDGQSRRYAGKVILLR